MPITAPSQLSCYQMALRMLADARLDTITDNVESRFALDDAWASAPVYVLRQAPWRFALLQTALTAGGSPVAGYTANFAYPSNWLRTHAIFLLNSQNRECPFDLRELGGGVSVNVTATPTMRYVSSAFADPGYAAWPEQFAECVAAYLAFLVAERVTGERSAPARMSQVFSSLMPAAITIDAEPEDPWLVHQRSGTLLRLARATVNEGFWRFALKTVNMANQASGPGDGGLTWKFPIPADWSRTRSLYVLASDGRRCPVDVREAAGFWHSNANGFYAQYVSETLAADATLWSDHYMRAVLRQIEFDQAQRRDSEQGPANYGRDYQLRADQAWKEALAAAQDSDADAPDPWLPHQLDGSFWRVAVEAMNRGFWRFGLKTADITASAGAGDGGLAEKFAIPADWSRTRSLYVLNSQGRRCPFDVREADGYWHSNTTAFFAQYLSKTVMLDATQWPGPYARAILRQLEFDTTARSADSQTQPQSEQARGLGGKDALADVLASEADGPDGWLAAQLDGSWLRVALAMIDEGFWRFALETADITTIAGAGDGGLANKFAIPADWSRTRSLYLLATDGRRCPLDVREADGFWHSNEAGFYAQYLSRTIAIDATQWPDHYLRAVLRAIELDALNRAPGIEAPALQAAAGAWKEALSDALDGESDGPDAWLRYELDGSFDRARRAVLARANWTFTGAMKTLDIDTSTQLAAPAESGFPYRFAKPADWFRTCALYVADDGQEHPINIRESAEDWSTDAPQFTARYISTAALEATNWPEIVAQAVLAYLDWQAAAQQPAGPQGAGAAKEQVGGTVFAALLADAARAHALGDDDWLRFQLDGRLHQARKFVAEKARWKFAIRTCRLETANDPGNATIALSGTVTPGDPLSVIINNGAIAGAPVTVSVAARNNDTLSLLASRLAGAIGSNAALAAAGITASVDTVSVQWLTALQQAGLPLGFPEPVLPAIGDPIVNIVLTQVLNPTVPQAVVATAEPGGGNVSYTLSVGGARSEIMTLGVYNAPLPSPGYTYRFTKPNDWLRTIRLYYSMEDGARPLHFDTDFRDEDGAYHANYFPVVIRYLSRALAYDATRWTANFRDAVLAWLQHIEARADPKLAAVAAAKLKLFQTQLADAEELDDTQEVPPIRTGGRMIRGRYGRGTLDIEQAMPPFVPL